MRYDPDRQHRRSMRRAGHDYSQAGAYYVTIVAHERECLFGAIVDGAVVLNDAGRIVWDVWKRLPEHYPHVALDAFIVMPNHVHAILVLRDPAAPSAQAVGAGLRPAQATPPSPAQATPPSPAQAMPPSPAQAGPGVPKRHGLPEIVRALKSFSARMINAARDAQGAAVWQRGYHERIICDEEEWAGLRAYIVGNPARWAEDAERPESG